MELHVSVPTWFSTVFTYEGKKAAVKLEDYPASVF